jgi:nicotinate-nucleotide pyrophosphorylase (carboxylating)
MPLTRASVLPLIRLALREDRAHQDVTSRTVLPLDLRIRARIIAKTSGVLAGVEAAAMAFTALDPSVRCRLHRRSSAKLSPGQPILTVEGWACSIFAAERTALNLLGHLSGIATLTQAYVQRVRGTRAIILDTRKTLPGLRALEKYAVRAGGGQSHRADLAQAVLIKTNHLKALAKARRSTVAAAIPAALARAKRSRRSVEIEVRNLSELRAALAAGARTLLLDNWSLAALRRAARLKPRGVIFEVSGGVTLANVRAIARTGVERISIGRLTHSAPSLNCSLTVL